MARLTVGCRSFPKEEVGILGGSRTPSVYDDNLTTIGLVVDTRDRSRDSSGSLTMASILTKVMDPGG